MKKTFLIPVLALLLLQLLPGCKPEGVIPPGDMESLLADFYKADATIQLLNESSTPVSIDSMRVYLPIVESYGYTKEEFRSSLEHYLHHPDQMTKIYKHLRAKLEQEAVRPTSVVSEEEEEETGENLRKGENRPAREDISTGEGTEPAIERVEEEKPVKQSKKNRKKLSKEEIKRLEEELK